MKIKKLTTSIILGSMLVATPVAVASILVNQNKSNYVFNGISFANRQSMENYINKTFGVKTTQMLSDNYYIEENGKRVYLGQSQIQQLGQDALDKSETKTIYSTNEDVNSNLINPSLGELSPKWFAKTEIEPSESIMIYRGSGNDTYLDQAEALDTFINSGYEVYYFNDIYFKNKQDLYKYLVNVYFTDESNAATTSLRIKGPTGEYSNVINMNAKSDWKSAAAAFVQDNALPVIKMKTNVGYKYISAKSDIAEAVGFDDIPYVKVKANQGVINQIIGLNANDQYNLSGGNYYSGYSDVGNAIVSPSNWTRSTSGFVSNYENAWIANYRLNINSLLDKFISRGVSSESDQDKLTYSSTYLFTSVARTMTTNHKILSSTVPSSIIGDSTNGFDFNESYSNGVVDTYATLTTSQLTSLSQTYANLFDATTGTYREYNYIYNQVLEIADNYASMQNYNALIRVPLLFASMMDRLISAGAPTRLIQATRAYFKNVTLVYQNILEEALGTSALNPDNEYASQGSLNLVSIFGIENETIEFDVQRYESFLAQAYPSLAVAASSYQYAILSAGFGMPLTASSIDELINGFMEDCFGPENFVNRGQVFTNTKNSLVYAINNSRTIMSNEALWEESSKDWAKFTASLLIASYVNDTTNREKVLDSMIDYAGELLNSPDSWELVPSDNIFRKYAYYVYSTEGKKLSPNDILMSMHGLDADLLFGWYLSLAEVMDDLMREDNATIANKIAEKSFDIIMDDEDQSYVDFVDDKNYKIDETYNNASSLTEQSTPLNMDSIFGSIYMTYDQYASVTIMRMLADISQKDTLFIFDEDKDAVVINPEYATAATELVIDLLENNPELMIQISFLYRGFQTIQENIEILSLKYPYKGSVDFELDSVTIHNILKHTAQYASVVNQNLELLQTKLSSIGVPLKTGQIIAYSGASTEMYETRDDEIVYDLNLSEEKVPYQTDIVNYDANAYLTKVDKTKSAYVIPNLPVQDGGLGKPQIFSSVYLHPTLLIKENMREYNFIEFQLDKFFDVSTWSSKLEVDLGLKHLYYEENVKFDKYQSSDLDDAASTIYVKKWGNNSFESIDGSTEETFGQYNENNDVLKVVDELIEPALPKIIDDEVVDEDIVDDENQTTGVWDRTKYALSTKDLQNYLDAIASVGIVAGDKIYAYSDVFDIANNNAEYIFINAKTENGKVYVKNIHSMHTDVNGKHYFRELDRIVNLKFVNPSDDIVQLFLTETKKDSETGEFISTRFEKYLYNNDITRFLAARWHEYTDKTTTKSGWDDWYIDKDKASMDWILDSDVDYGFSFTKNNESNALFSISGRSDPDNPNLGDEYGGILRPDDTGNPNAIPSTSQGEYLSSQSPTFNSQVDGTPDKKIQKAIQNINENKAKVIDPNVFSDISTKKYAKVEKEAKKGLGSKLKERKKVNKEKKLARANNPDIVSTQGEVKKKSVLRRKKNTSPNALSSTADLVGVDGKRVQTPIAQKAIAEASAVFHYGDLDLTALNDNLNVFYAEFLLRKVSDMANFDFTSVLRSSITQEMLFLATMYDSGNIDFDMFEKYMNDIIVNKCNYGVDNLKDLLVEDAYDKIRSGDVEPLFEYNTKIYKVNGETFTRDELSNATLNQSWVDAKTEILRKKVENFNLDASTWEQFKRKYFEKIKSSNMLDMITMTKTNLDFEFGLAEDAYVNWLSGRFAMMEIPSDIINKPFDLNCPAYIYLDHRLVQMTFYADKLMEDNNLKGLLVGSIYNDVFDNLLISQGVAKNKFSAEELNLMRTTYANYLQEERRLLEEIQSGRYPGMDDWDKSIKQLVVNVQASRVNMINGTYNDLVATSTNLPNEIPDLSAKIPMGSIGDVAMTGVGTGFGALGSTTEVIDNAKSQVSKTGTEVSKSQSKKFKDVGERVKSKNKNLTDAGLAAAMTTNDDSSVSSSKNKLNQKKKSRTSFMNKKGFKIAFGIIDFIDIAVSLATFALMITSIVESTKEQPCAYVFRTDDGYEWQWSGGSYKYETGLTNNLIDIRTASDMKMNSAIKINHSYIRDSYYYDGKLYEDSINGRKTMLEDYIKDLETSVYTTTSNTNTVVYSFDNTLGDGYIESSVNLDKQLGLYSSKLALANSVVNDISKNADSSQYVSMSVKSFSDGWGGNWSSINSDAAMEAAAKSVQSKLRSTIISLRPVLDESGYLKERRIFNSMLPGDSYDSVTNKVITEEAKRSIDSTFNTNNWFIIDDSANLLDAQGNHVTSAPVVAVENAKNAIKQKTIENYQEGLKSIKTYDTESVAIRSSSYSDVEQVVKNGIAPRNVLVYTTKDGTRYFVDTLDSNARTVTTAYENLLAFIREENNIKLHVETREVIDYYKYNGYYFDSINDLLAFYNS